MKNDKKLQYFLKNCDLADEAHRLLRGDDDCEISGVEEKTDITELGKISTIRIINEAGAKAMGKPIGTYITAEFPHFLEEEDLILESGEILSSILEDFLPSFDDKRPVLIVGLGNPNTAADELGVKIIEKTMITRHFFQALPEDKREGFRSVAAITPNVTHNTGIEAAELIIGLVREIEPSCVIVADALAAGSIKRVGTSIQIADTGITPGSGVGNHRLTLNRETLGVPVIAIGVPMVVYTETIIDEVLNHCQGDESSTEIFGKEITNFAVTPKDIEYLNEKVSGAISAALHLALHPGINTENIYSYLPL